MKWDWIAKETRKQKRKVQENEYLKIPFINKSIFKYSSPIDWREHEVCANITYLKWCACPNDYWEFAAYLADILAEIEKEVF